MDANIASSKQVVRWEVLPGLPGEGPAPLHFHTGHPTPWKEGVAVRLCGEDGTEWVGNFQARCAGADVLLWPEANALAVIAGGNFYLIDADDPGSYSTLGSHFITTEIMLDQHRHVLVVAEGYGLHAFGLNRKRLRMKGPGEYIRRIVNCEGGTVTVEIGGEYGGPLARPETVQISIEDESEQLV